MKCSYCQHENSDGNLFCSECGRKLKASENQGVSEVNNTGVENAKKKKRRSPIRIVRNVLISIALIIVLIIVSLFVYITSTPFVRRQYMEYDYFFVEDMYDHGFLRKNSQLYMGLIYIDDGEYDQAYEIFKKVYDPLRRFPNTDFIDGYELYVALALDRGDISYEQLGEVDYAITGYERELVATRERVLENFYYLADNSAVESEADLGSIQEPISNSYRIYILMERRF